MEFNFRSACMVLGFVGTGVSAFTSIGAFCVDYRKTAIAASVATCVFAFLFGGTLFGAKPARRIMNMAATMMNKPKSVEP